MLKFMSNRNKAEHLLEEVEGLGGFVCPESNLQHVQPWSARQAKFVLGINEQDLMREELQILYG